MKPLLLLLVTAAAPPAAAQQMLYASTCGGDLVEILDYATAPTLRMIPRNSQHNGAQDIAVRPGTGLICVLDQVSSLPNLYEIDPLTGNAVNGASCFSWLSFSMSLEARYDNSLVGEEWMGAGRLMYTDTSLECFSSWGPATGCVNDGDIAQRNDGSFLASRAGSSALFFIHPSTGNATLAADFGISFSGLEIDTDGSIYGLTRDGLLYRVELTPPSVILLAVLPPATAGACLSNGWSGLAFSLPACPIEFETVCTADPNSTGNAAGLSVDFNPVQPPATGAGVLGFRVADMPPDHAAILLEDVLRCPRCHGRRHMISVITDPETVRDVLEGVRKASKSRGLSTSGGEPSSPALSGSPPPGAEARIPIPPRQGRLDFGE